MTLPSDLRPASAAPVLAICGFSGSGKTTLLESVIPILVARGLSVAIIKHDAHGVQVDRPGKDSDRLFRAGASIALRGPEEQFHRRHASATLSLSATLAWFARDHDVVLVEGHKDTPLPKFWLQNSDCTPIPDHVTNIVSVLPWDGDRLKNFFDYFDAWLPMAWNARPVYAGMLIGSESSRTESPKPSLNAGSGGLVEIAAGALTAAVSPNPLVLLGGGLIPQSLEDMPRLANAPGLDGPEGGIISAHRWAPQVGWMVSGCDHPWVQPEALTWLVSQRRPGTWAVIPRPEDGHPCPSLAFYEPQAITYLERQAIECPEPFAALLRHKSTVIVIPPEHRNSWADIAATNELTKGQR